MTTFVQFNPTPNALFQFTATFDGQQYNVIVTWNLSRQGWYYNVVTLQGGLIVAAALVGSPPDYDINLLFGYFTATLVFRSSTQQFEIGP